MNWSNFDCEYAALSFFAFFLQKAGTENTVVSYLMVIKLSGSAKHPQNIGVLKFQASKPVIQSW